MTLAILGAVHILIAVPLLDLYAEREAAVEGRLMLLSRLNAAAGELPGLRARVAELRIAASTQTVTLEGASDAIASAALQGRIEELAATAGATIGSTESLPAEARGAYRRLGLRLVLSGRYETLMTLLAKLEMAAPPLVVDNLQVRGELRRPGAPPAAVLDAGLDVYGLRANEMPAMAKP